MFIQMFGQTEFLVRHNKMNPVVLCIVFLHGLFGGFGILERKQQKETLQCGTREGGHENKCCLSMLVAMLVGLLPPHLVQIELHNSN